MPRKKPTERRPRGAGTVIVRKDGRVMIRAHLPDAYDKIHHVTEYLPRGSSKADGERRLDELNDGAKRKTARVVTPETVGAYLERWLLTTIAPRAKPKTVDNYRFAIAHCDPIAHLDLRHLTEEHVLQLQADLRHDLAQSSTVFILTVLKAALKAAQAKKLLFEHPMAGIVIGTPHSDEIEPLSPAEARAMLQALEGHPLKVALELAVFRGLRSGEIRGLTWAACDLDRADLFVRSTLYVGRPTRFELVAPKTTLSRRWVPLSDALVRSLRQRHAQQGFDRMRHGSLYVNELDLVVTGRTGNPIASGSLLELTRHACRVAGVPVTTVHALRHTANTIMAQEGVDERTRMAILGHANVRVNARYVHSDRERIRAAVAALEDRIRTG
jgi:integrase